ncbi:Flp pilus assembly protein CpaB [Miltoncostaea marina]|uniref:Flp pilus assembly protein CpaB n=1 Tax=Miltoncostaea marina TaxID=2843215 RepID=UPI001C3D3650|nr:Flp pilus assembly protein CpaB [Miltoncostaea marina]
MRRRLGGARPGGWLLLAGLVGLLAAAMTLRAGAGEPAAGGAVVVARQELRPGLLIDADVAATALVAVPAPAMPGVTGLAADPAALVGRTVAVPVAPGEPLTEAALGGAAGLGPRPLADGERAVSVPLTAAGGAAAGLLPGARVDVVASTGEGAAGRTAVVVADAEVLAVVEATAPDGLAQPAEALLRVSAAQALRITAAVNFAREVRLLARPAGEIDAPPAPRAVDAP